MTPIEAERDERRRPGVLHAVCLALTLMPPGFNLALPGIDVGTSWSSPYEVFHGIFVHDVMTFVWMGVASIAAILGTLRPSLSESAKRFAGLIALLMAVGLISTLANSFRYGTLADLGEIARLAVAVFYFLLASHWAARYGAAYVMRWFLLGVALGGALNIYLSITVPYNAVGVLPFLYSRNGAGGIVALSIALSAWTWLVSGPFDRLDRAVSVLTAVVGVVGVAMSFSKTAMLTGAVGLIEWIVVLRMSPRNVLRLRVLAPAALLVLVGLVALPAGAADRVWQSLTDSVETKFTLVLSPAENGSVRDRLGYYAAVGEILAANPVNLLIGVGVSGFLPAVSETRSYAHGLVEEDENAGKLSNPHNSYLYYLSANGLPGLVMITALLWAFVRGIYESVTGSRRFALGVAGGLAIAYVLYGSALPSLYKTYVMYAPAAAAMAVVKREQG